MTIAVYGHHTMKNAKRIVFDEGINIAPRKKSQRERVTELSRRWRAEQQEREEAAQRAREASILAKAEERRRKTERVGTSYGDPQTIISMVAAWHGVAETDLLGKGREHHLVRARYDAIAAVHLNCRINGARYSSPALGRLFGRDHTVCLKALRERGLK